MRRTRQLQPNQNEINLRLDNFLTIKIPRLSRSQAQKIISNNGISLFSKRIPKNNTRITSSEIVFLHQNLPTEPDINDNITLIFENDDFYIFNKPAGILTHPTANHYKNTITFFLESNNYPKTWVTHRLDRETSGLIILAKSKNVASKLNKLFQNNLIQKTYIAIADNTKSFFKNFEPIIINQPLGFCGIHLPKITIGKGHLPASTTCTPIEFKNTKILLQLQPHTGRQHQLRAHLALNNTPIFGDKLYYYSELDYKNYLDNKPHPDFYPKRLMLHAFSLEFLWNQSNLCVYAPIPTIFETFWNETLPPNKITSL